MSDILMKSNNEIDNVNKTIKYRLLLTAFAIAIIFIFLSFYLINIVKTKGVEYNKIILSQKQSSFITKTIQAKRGDIFDANGILLATSKKVYNLILDPRVILSESDDRYKIPVADAITNIFGDDREKIYDSINKRANSSYVRYKRFISVEDKLKFDNYVLK